MGRNVADAALEVCPDGVADARDEVRALLVTVAERALITRKVRAQDWGAHADRVEGWCWAALGEALEELQATDPDLFDSDAVRAHDALIGDIRRDLGLGPAAEAA